MLPPMLITRQSDPDNLEAPFGPLLERRSPPGGHYVRSHFPVPALDAGFTLRVTGEVERPLTLGLAEVQALGAETRTVTMECAGNGRVYLSPKVSGVQWALGAVGTADWTGVPLRAVLELAGLRPGALEVVLTGADRGVMTEPVRSPGEAPYARSLPLDKALEDVLLAYAMNGRPLTPAHGAPLRAVVPGWYGMAAVKWLTGLHVTSTPYQGYFQTVDYARWETRADLPPERVPLSAMQVKSQIAHPAPHAQVPAGQPCEITGAAWTGEGTVTRVDVSTDGGQSWQAAAFLDPAEPGVWRRWTLSWTPRTPGPVTLLSRATDSAGHTQPAAHDPRNGTYVVHHVLPVPVHVQEGAS